MPSQPSAPATTSEAELHETLDLLGTLMASVSDCVAAQTKALDRLDKIAAEARQSAFAARAQADPGRFSAEIKQTLG